MKIAPLDLRQPRFRTVVRGFDRAEVAAFLSEAADDYEQALREIDRLRQELARAEALVAEHRERETTLRNTLLTAQRLADELRETAEAEARMIVREAQGRADLLLQKAQARLEEFEREIGELKLRRRDVERSIESSIAALQHALEFVRTQERAEDKLRLHRPRAAEAEPPLREGAGSRAGAGGAEPAPLRDPAERTAHS